MRITNLLVLLILLAVSIQPISAETDTIIYKEVIESYSRIDGRTLRWDFEREFLFKGFTLFEDNSSVTKAKILMEDGSQNGQIEEIIQHFRPVNFLINPIYLSNGTLREIRYDILLVRDAVDGGDGGEPFEPSDFVLLTRNGRKRYDLKSNNTFFTVNLQYFEALNTSKADLEQIKVNTELATNNLEDGTIVRTSIHIIKRNAEQEVLYEYDWSIQKVNNFAKLFNWLDQPMLWVPAQIGLVFLLVYIYIRAQRYWSTNKISLSITKRKKTED